MPDRLKLPVAIASILAIAVSIAVIWRGVTADHASFDSDTHWLCSAGHRFTLSVRQLSDHHQHHYGHPIPCPVCRSTHTDRDRSIPIAGAAPGPSAAPTP